MNGLKLALAAGALVTSPVVAQGLDHYPVRGGVHLFTAPSGNIVVFVGKDGTMVIDPGTAATSEALLAEIAKLSPDKPIRWVMDTGAAPEHVGANLAISSKGVQLEGGNTRPTAAVGEIGAPIWAHEGVLNRMTAEGSPGAPSNSYFVASKDFWANGEAVQMLSASPGQAEGDSIVYLRGSEVIVAGDLYTPGRYPQIDVDHGGSIQGVLNGLNMLLRYTVAEFNQQGGTLVIPGHGRISDEADVALYRDMVTIVHDRVKDMVGKGRTLAQIQAARPTFDYDSVYGEAAGRTFIEQIYRSLTRKPAKGRAAA